LVANRLDSVAISANYVDASNAALAQERLLQEHGEGEQAAALAETLRVEHARDRDADTDTDTGRGTDRSRGERHLPWDEFKRRRPYVFNATHPQGPVVERHLRRMALELKLKLKLELKSGGDGGGRSEAGGAGSSDGPSSSGSSGGPAGAGAGAAGPGPGPRMLLLFLGQNVPLCGHCVGLDSLLRSHPRLARSFRAGSHLPQAAAAAAAVAEGAAPAEPAVELAVEPVVEPVAEPGAAGEPAAAGEFAQVNVNLLMPQVRCGSGGTSHCAVIHRVPGATKDLLPTLRPLSCALTFPSRRVALRCVRLRLRLRVCVCVCVCVALPLPSLLPFPSPPPASPPPPAPISQDQPLFALDGGGGSPPRLVVLAQRAGGGGQPTVVASRSVLDFIAPPYRKRMGADSAGAGAGAAVARAAGGEELVGPILRSEVPPDRLFDVPALALFLDSATRR
jgi:hypothetical protein